MVKIGEINRTSTFAWSLDALPLLATGTVAGAVDINFTSSATLEIWEIFSPTKKNEPIFTASVEHKFYALAWSKPFENRPKGLIAGAFEDGTVEFWDADVLIKSKNLKKASVHKSTKHSGGAVKSLQFNPIQHHVLVTGGSNGQIFVWDTKTFGEPFSPGQAMTPMDEISCVAWNNSVSHILASTGNSGYTSIWDLKSKKEVLHLSYTGATGKANFSHVAWHPTKSTKLVTASDSESCPVILTWDLRNSNAPEKVMEGHKKGVLSLDWCKQDPELLISSGKDNATILWNPIEGKKLGEYPTTANWAFKTRFAPSAPDIFATASFDGKIIVQTIQDTSPPVSTKVSASHDDNEFWSELSVTETQQPVFEVKQAPVWLKNPVSVSFGFGSKLVVVGKDANGKSTLKVTKFLVKGHERAENLLKHLKSENYDAIVDYHLQGPAINEQDKSDWEVLKSLSKNGKQGLFDDEEDGSDTTEEKKNSANKEDADADATTKDKDIENGKDGKDDTANAANDGDGDDDFFAHLGNGSTRQTVETYSPSGDFDIYNSQTSKSDKKLTKLILKNKIDDAVDSCLEQDNLLEALVLALDSSAQVKEKVKNAYFSKHKESSLARVIYNATEKNVTDLVAHANVKNWKDIALGISAFATDSEEYSSKISELGDRILHHDKSARDEAITCYIAGGALDKIANLWLQELPQYEADLLKTDDKNISSPSEARLQALTSFVEKIETFKYYAKLGSVLSGPLVEPISKTILEFVNLISGAGEFELANKLLMLLPGDIAGVEKERISKATGKDTKPIVSEGSAARASVSSSKYSKIPRKSLTSANANANANANVNSNASSTGALPTPATNILPPLANHHIQGQTPSFVQPQPQTAFGQLPTPSTSSAYPTAPVAKSNPYAKPNPYTPNNIYKTSPVPQPSVAPQASFSGTAPPPPPAVQKANSKEGWNDLPETFKLKTTAPRRAAATGTPAPLVAPVASLGNQPNVAQPHFGPPKRTISTNSFAPPPPKSVSRASSKNSVPVAAIASPKPPAPPTTKYAPPAGSSPLYQQTPSSSTPPTASASPRTVKKNPYAPTTETIPPKISYATPPPQLIATGPPTPVVPPPKNPYAPPPAANTSYGPTSGIALPIAPPQQSFGSAMQTPVQPAFNGFPAPPPTGPSPAMRAQVKEQPPAKEPTPEVIAPKHPKGDRTHIPEDALPIYELLSKVVDAIKPNIPEKYARHGADMEQRLNILFDHLNNEELSSALIASLKQVSTALESKDFESAKGVDIDIATNYSDELGNWHTGLKRLITMAEAMY